MCCTGQNMSPLAGNIAIHSSRVRLSKTLSKILLSATKSAGPPVSVLKPLKGADVSLNYEEYISDIVMGLDGEFREENVRKRVRPWVVRGKNRETKTFGDFERAVEVFDHQARELAPASHHDHA